MNPQYNKEDFEKIITEMSNIGILEYDYGDLYDHNGPIKGEILA